MVDISISVIGFSGSLLLSAGFALQVLGLIGSKHQDKFLVANLLGAICLSFPAAATGTAVALLLNAFWGAVSIAGLVESRLNRRGQILPTLFKVIGPAVCLLALLNSWRAGFAPLEVAASFSVLLFVLGFFAVVSNAEDLRFRAFYFVSALVGNVLYVPLLFANANYPNLALQLTCTAIALLGVYRVFREGFAPEMA